MSTRQTLNVCVFVVVFFSIHYNGRRNSKIHELIVKYMNSCLPFVVFTTKVEEILNM